MANIQQFNLLKGITRMKLNTLKNAMILAASGFMATSAFADDFNVANQTKYDLSFQVNGTCSQAFGKVDSYTIKNIAESIFINACKSNTEPCEVKVYGVNLCQGEPLLMVQYYISDNFVSLHQYSADISSAVSGYNLFLTGPLNFKKTNPAEDA